MTPNLIITPTGGVEIVVSYDPIQTQFGAINGNVGAFDNRLIRSDGNTGGFIQGSPVTVSDSGDIDCPGGVTVAGNLLAGGDSVLSGDVTVSGEINVSGDADFSSNVSADSITSANAVTGQSLVALSGGISTTGDISTSLGDISCPNGTITALDGTINSSLQVTGTVNCGGVSSPLGTVSAKYLDAGVGLTAAAITLDPSQPFTSGSIKLGPTGSVYSNSGGFSSVSGNISTSSGNITTVTGTVSCKNLSVSTNINAGTADLSIKGVTGVSASFSNYVSTGDVTANNYFLTSGETVAKTLNANGDPNIVSVYVKSNGPTFAAGEAVYISSCNGANKIISKAQANSEIASSTTLGLVKSAISANGFGYVVTQGLLKNLNITGTTAAEGDPVWLSPTTAGGLVFGTGANKPKSPNHLVYLGIVVKMAGTTVQEIEVKVDNSNELSELSDVKLTTPTTNDFLVYNSTGGLWENKNPAAVNAILGSGFTKSRYVDVRSSTGLTTATVSFKGWELITNFNEANKWVAYCFPLLDTEYSSITSYQLTLHLVQYETVNYTFTEMYSCFMLTSTVDRVIPSVPSPSTGVSVNVTSTLTADKVQQANIVFPPITVSAGTGLPMPIFMFSRVSSIPSTANVGIIGVTLVYS